MTKDLKTSLPLLNFRWHFSTTLQDILKFVMLTCLLEKRRVRAPPITKSDVSASSFFTKKLKHQAAKLVGYYLYWLDPSYIYHTKEGICELLQISSFFLCVCACWCTFIYTACFFKQSIKYFSQILLGLHLKCIAHCYKIQQSLKDDSEEISMMPEKNSCYLQLF